MLKLFIIILTMALTSALPFSAQADSARSLVNKGNQLFINGKYDEALQAYKLALMDAPDNARIYFNKGTAYYRKGDFQKAGDAFERAALKSANVRLEADSKFNMGNCFFKVAAQEHDSDPEKSLEAFRKSVQLYQDALELDADFREAGENIETARFLIKSVLGEINKRQQAAKKQQEARKNTVNQIKGIIKKQKQLMKHNKALSEEQRQNGDPHDFQNRVSGLVNGQRRLNDKTVNLAKKLGQQMQGKGAYPGSLQEWLENAAENQKNAVEKIGENQFESAQKNQQRALANLKGALRLLSEDWNNQNNNQHQSGQAVQPGVTGEEALHTANIQMPDDAEEILEEEKKNKKRRKSSTKVGYKKVDRDW